MHVSKSLKLAGGLLLPTVYKRAPEEVNEIMAKVNKVVQKFKLNEIMAKWSTLLEAPPTSTPEAFNEIMQLNTAVDKLNTLVDEYSGSIAGKPTGGAAAVGKDEEWCADY